MNEAIIRRPAGDDLDGLNRSDWLIDAENIVCCLLCCIHRLRDRWVSLQMQRRSCYAHPVIELVCLVHIDEHVEARASF